MCHYFITISHEMQHHISEIAKIFSRYLCIYSFFQTVHNSFTHAGYNEIMNILFYLTPKCDCAILSEDATVRQALEKMENASFTSIPLLSKSGAYAGTLSEGDLLWNLKNRYNMDVDLKYAERIRVSELERKRDYMPISASADMNDIVRLAVSQNFVPVQDDDGKFIGIVTRTDVMKYLIRKADPLSQN